MTENTQSDIRAAFMSNRKGGVCIAFDDPAYVRADAILVNNATGAIHAILHESAYFLGNVTETMGQAFLSSRRALLTALRPDGSVFELTAPVQEERA